VPQLDGIDAASKPGTYDLPYRRGLGLRRDGV